MNESIEYWFRKVYQRFHDGRWNHWAHGSNWVVDEENYDEIVNALEKIDKILNKKEKDE